MAFAKYFIIIFLAPTLVLLNFHLLVFNMRFYKSEFKKLNVYQNFQTEEQVDQHANNLIRYFCCRDKLDNDYYSEREQLHLIDVKRLINVSTIEFVMVSALTIGSLIFLVFKKKNEIALFALRWGSIVTLLSILILWLTSFINFPKFEKTFVTFHEVAFDNDLWQLPPEANLIKLFPAQFFADFANRVAFQTIAMSLVILATTLIIKKHVAKKH